MVIVVHPTGGDKNGGRQGQQGHERHDACHVPRPQAGWVGGNDGAIVSDVHASHNAGNATSLMNVHGHQHHEAKARGGMTAGKRLSDAIGAIEAVGEIFIGFTILPEKGTPVSDILFERVGHQLRHGERDDVGTERG